MPGSDSAQAIAGTLLEVVRRRVPAEASAWLARGLPESGAGFNKGAFLGFYAGAARRLRSAVAPFDAGELERLRAAGLAVPEAWSLADLARAALLLRACSVMQSGDHVALATEIFRRGDSGERVSLLRALGLLPGPARFAELGAEACRTHVLDVFAAVACDNPFPARYFEPLNFNQLVMKTLFVELPLARVLGLRGRIGPELLRMATDYEAERRAAGRTVPADIALLRAASEAP